MLLRYRPHVEELEERTLLSFLAPPMYSVGPYPGGIAVGDFNGDGIPDLAVPNGFTPPLNLSILLGKGDGTFQAPRGFSTSIIGPLAVGDFNGDGHLDLAIAGGQQLSILLGNGDGTFQRPRTSPLPFLHTSLQVADFNGDGQLDLVLCAYQEGTVKVLLGNGDGTFQAPLASPAGTSPESLAVGDFNGDGIADLAVVDVSNPYAIPSLTGNVSVLLGQGDGTFQAPLHYDAGSFPQSVVVGDFNGDGHPDLALVDSPGPSSSNYAPPSTIRIFVGNADGTFQAASMTYSVTSQPILTVGDFNGDSHLDLALINTYAETVSVFLGNGDASFQPSPISFPVAASSLNSPYFMIASDFNGDGHLDVAVAGDGYAYPSLGPVTILLGDGTGGFQDPLRSYPAGSSSRSVAIGDFNGDGIADLAVANEGAAPDYSGTVSILRGNGDGTFQSSQSYAVGSDAVAVAVGDFNGDGIADLAVVNDRSDSVTLLLGNGDGTFRLLGDTVVGAQPIALAVADLNGDGLLDLVVVNQGTSPDYQGTVSILLGNGDGTFQAAQNLPVGWHPLTVAVGDMNGDGHLELVVGDWGPGYSQDGSLNLLLGRGDGTFLAPRQLEAGNPTMVVLADVNGDGKEDIILAENYVNGGGTHTRSLGVINVLLGNSNGTFRAGRIPFAGDYGVSVAVADVNRDGIPDLLLDYLGEGFLTSFTIGAVGVMLGIGDGTFGPVQYYSAARFPQFLATGDFNSDGYPDIAVVNQIPGTVTVLLNAADWSGGHGVAPNRPPRGPAVHLLPAYVLALAQAPAGSTFTLMVSGHPANPGQQVLLTTTAEQAVVTEARLGPASEWRRRLAQDVVLEDWTPGSLYEEPLFTSAPAALGNGFPF